MVLGNHNMEMVTAGSRCSVSECRGPYKIGVVQKIVALLQAVRFRQVWYIIGDYLVNELCLGTRQRFEGTRLI